MLSNRVAPIICLFLILTLTVLVYSPGLKGGFIFDDLPNLGQMNQYGDMRDWDNIKKFVSSGNAGPTSPPNKSFGHSTTRWVTYRMTKQ